MESTVVEHKPDGGSARPLLDGPHLRQLSRSRLQLDGLLPNACVKSLPRCAESEKPALRAISFSDAELVIIRLHALSSRLLTT
jgi:hypothetical protein